MDQELKQRMIGASVIIALAVIFVPMLFDGDIDEKHNKNISITLPDVADNGLEVKKFELDKPVSKPIELPASEAELVVKEQQPVLMIKEETVPSQTETVTPKESNNIQSESVETKAAEVKVAEIPDTQNIKKSIVNDKPVEQISKPKEELKTPKNTVSTAKQLNQVFRVKLGSFSQQSNAEKVKSSLAQKNINTVVEFNPGLKLYRVWSQQMYQEETSAQSFVHAVNKLKLNIGTPKIITLTASEVDQMASQGQLGWVVQLGSFSDKKNAIELRNKVKAAGFKAFVDVFVNSKGVSLYRLRVGPLMEKIDAESTQVKIKNKLKLDGLIKSHELGRIIN